MSATRAFLWKSLIFAREMLRKKKRGVLRNIAREKNHEISREYHENSTKITRAPREQHENSTKFHVTKTPRKNTKNHEKCTKKSYIVFPKKNGKISCFNKPRECHENTTRIARKSVFFLQKIFHEHITRISREYHENTTRIPTQKNGKKNG